MATTAERTGSSTESGQQGAASNTASFHNPLHAIVDGEPATVIALGDVQGMSPAFLCVDQQGNARWESQKNVRIVDPRALPFSQEQVRQLSQGGSGASTGRSSSGRT